jgi:hypothetical protein
VDTQKLTTLSAEALSHAVGKTDTIDLIARENIDENTQFRHRSTQHIRSATVIDDRAVALQIDFKGRKRLAPMLGLQPAVCRLLYAKHWVRFVGKKPRGLLSTATYY